MGLLQYSVMRSLTFAIVQHCYSTWNTNGTVILWRAYYIRVNLATAAGMEMWCFTGALGREYNGRIMQSVFSYSWREGAAGDVFYLLLSCQIVFVFFCYHGLWDGLVDVFLYHFREYDECVVFISLRCVCLSVYLYIFKRIGISSFKINIHEWIRSKLIHLSVLFLKIFPPPFFFFY